MDTFYSSPEEKQLIRMKQHNYAIIIGAMKSGTSSLFRYLSQHPEIAGSWNKEPNFFCDTKNLQSGPDKYNRLWFLRSFGKKLLLEASTNYTKYPTFQGVPNAISSFKIDPYLIYIVRNPFDRILSHYNHLIKFGRQSNIKAKHLLEVSNYLLQLKQYEQYFNLQKLQIIDFDELVRDPQAVLDQLSSFLDLRSFTFDTTKAYNRNKHTKNKKTNPAGYRKNLTQEERDYIYSNLKNDIIQFGQTFNFNVSKWGF